MRGKKPPKYHNFDEIFAWGVSCVHTLYRSGLNLADPSHTKLGMVIEDLEHVFATVKRLGMRRTVSLLGALKNRGKPILPS